MIDFQCLLVIAAIIGGGLSADQCGKFDPKKKGVNWPWSVSVFGDGQFRCLGTLVSKDRIITAARCVDPELFATKDWTVTLADTKEPATVDKVFMHEEYVKKIDKSSDIAILTLKDDVKISDKLMPVCAQEKGKEEQMTDCRTVSIIPDIDSIEGGQRKNLKAKNIDQKTCKAKTFKGGYLKSTEDLLCVKIDQGDEKNGCSRNDVSPLYCNEDKKWYLSGIALSCGDKTFPAAKGHYAWYLDVCNCMDDMIPTSEQKEEDDASGDEEADDVEPTKDTKNEEVETGDEGKVEKEDTEDKEDKKEKKEKEKKKKKDNKNKEKKKKKKENKRKQEMKKMGWSKKKGSKKEAKNTKST